MRFAFWDLRRLKLRIYQLLRRLFYYPSFFSFLLYSLLLFGLQKL
ncbi:hypothetical protein BAXH7_01629 [Bacillus amyloliquefaciens XH7]|nr:hypothetical protein BAXH7_01629 [Bacillus amyloliquefaciens XH7]